MLYDAFVSKWADSVTVADFKSNAFVKSMILLLDVE